MNTNDPYHIIPKAVQFAQVRPFDFQVRTIIDYDPNFLQDRAVSEVFVNGKPVGVYAVARVDDNFTNSGPLGLERALRTYAPDLERMVVDEFMGLGYRKRVRELEDQLKVLNAFVNRDRWWQFKPVRRQVASLRARLADAIRSPTEED